MGRRYSFELFYPAERVTNAVAALDPYRPSHYRKRRGELVRKELTGPPDLSGLSPETPLFWSLSLLFPADEIVRGWRDWSAHDSEWNTEGAELLPVGSIDLTVRTGAQYALLTFAARTRGISHVFAGSRGVWAQFNTILQDSGGLIAIFDGTTDIGTQTYPMLPDGTSLVEFDYRNFILEERDRYWHLDVDRYARAVLAAKNAFARRFPS